MLIREIRGLLQQLFEKPEHFRIFASTQPTDRSLATLHRSLWISRYLDQLVITRSSLIRLLDSVVMPCPGAMAHATLRTLANQGLPEPSELMI